jgi:hypothetical protein
METFEVSPEGFKRLDIEVKIADLANKTYFNIDHELQQAENKAMAESIFDRFLSGEQGFFAEYNKANEVGSIDVKNNILPNLVFNQEDLASFKLNMEALFDLLKKTDEKYQLNSSFEYSSKILRILKETDFRLNQLQKGGRDGEQIAA